MFKPLSLAIGLRYTRAKRRTRFISFISFVSIAGISLGVAALITVISVMNGFGEEVRGRLLGMVAHATVSAAGSPMEEWPRAVDIARADPRVAGAAPYIERAALLQGRREEGAMLRGVLPEAEPSVSEFAEKIVVGDIELLQPGEYNIILGRELANWAQVSVGETVNVFVPSFRTTPVGVLPQVRRFNVVGIFETGYQDADRGIGLIHMQDAQRLLRMGEGVTGVRLKLHDMFQSNQVSRDLADQLGGIYRISDWSRDHANFFRAMKIEKIMIFIVVALVVAVAAFNLVSSLVMLVTDKQADIAILRTLGIRPATVLRVFMIQGVIIGTLGVLIGVVGGVLLTLNLDLIVTAVESTFGIEVMPKDVYYITGLPTALYWDEVALIAGIGLVMALLATLYPAWRASRTAPAEALRYE
ncbi:lipoprotein-releasing ABC transporter permease subunit [Alkalisalibacterium limincola]|uniref:Lipoprotein-releasing ABC transporter permease subunit n=1 Tax=Alkalisalibacterium limincola TaxID=2699169 RepID=A0A5C8L0E3_9GAMM|nr:lipoprotein-releasing ABC transporter permease subunit [Alkalisalibacterium limincola]TXK65623.1 lipoprotein-releasing ABC transporter permease subunit [Alkalisalibacterium limincola]